MNPRIKELAEKSGFMMWSDEPWKPEGAIVDWSCNYDSELEKFAELIVKECSQYIEDKFDFCGDEIIIAEAVLKHFGVEE